MANEERHLKVKLCKSEEPGEMETHVVEACCAAWQPKEGDMFTWPVRRCLARRDDKGLLRIAIAEPFGDWITCPWKFCPSCGAAVEVVEWEEPHHPLHGNGQSIITSGEFWSLIEEVRHES